MKPALLLMIVISALANGAIAQSTAFSYQGRLKNGAALATGLHDLRFRLWDAASAGTQVGSTQCADNILVSEGVFTATIDFGQQFVTPSARFLEIEVRADTGLSCGSAAGFVVLAPRQALTAAPLASNATHANAAFSLDAADGSPANAVFVDNNGKVGVGTLAPTHTVHIATAGPTIALQDTNAASQQAGYVSYRDNANAERAWVGYGTPGSPDFTILNARPGGDIVLTPLNGDNVILVGNGGNVGVGTFAPAAKLDVRGDIRLGPVGQYRAVSGEENLRIIRGIVGEDGSIIVGTGFSVTRPSTGDYIITFSSSFSGLPSVTAIGHFVTLQCPSSINTFAVTTSSARLFIRQVGCGGNESLANQRFQFIAVGPR